jgi:hypothetical protein
VRGLLKKALHTGEIPLESKEMGPKAVFTLYQNANNPVVAEVVYGEKFTCMLPGLWKNHKNGDLQNEDQPKAIEWSKSAAKQFWKRCFRERTISANYQDAQQVWTNHCKDDKAFKRVQCDDAFVRQLKTVQDDYLKKVEICQKDLEAFNIAKKNHATPEFNIHGEPQSWICCTETFEGKYGSRTAQRGRAKEYLAVKTRVPSSIHPANIP